MFENNPGNPSDGAQASLPANPQANPQASPPASAQPGSQSAPAAGTAAAQPASPPVKNDGETRDKPKKKEEGISIRPNFLLCALFQALNLFILIAVLVFVLRMVGIDLQKDVIDILAEAFNQLTATSEDLGGVPMFGMLLGQMRDTLIFTFIQVIILGLILQIPVVNNHWRIFSDRLEYKVGFILLKTKTIRFSDVKNVSFKSYTSFADFGKVTIEYSGGESKGITMPYVFHASRLTADINSRVKQHQMKEVAAMAKRPQAQASKAGGVAPVKPTSGTARPLTSQP